jgi:magnesium-transporting ATPase (P-type)
VTRDGKINKKIRKRLRKTTVKQEPKKKKGFFKSMDMKKQRIILVSFLTIIIIIFSIPFLSKGILGRKVGFFIEMIVFTLLALMMFVSGLWLFFEKSRKERGFFKKLFIKTISALITIGSIVIFIGYVADYYKDIPEVVTSDYSTCRGKLTSYRINSGRHASTDLTIDEKEFKVEGKLNSSFLVKGRKYCIEYLPNTKFVMNVYSYSG